MTKVEILRDGNKITTYARGNDRYETSLVHVLTLICGVSFDLSEDDYQRLANIPRKSPDTGRILEAAEMYAK